LTRGKKKKKLKDGKKKKKKKKRRSKRRSWLAKVARYTLRSADARHECKRGHYARVREVKRFTTPVACGLGQARMKKRDREEEEGRESWPREKTEEKPA